MPPRTSRAVPAGPVLPPARRHKPSGKPSWPRILVTGETGTRKSSLMLELSADHRIDNMWVIEIGDGENTAEEYGVLPNVDYEIIDHDGSYAEIHDQLAAHWQEAKAAEQAGQVIALGIDAMSGINAMLSDMVDTRARRRLAQQLVDKNQDPSQAWLSEREVTVGGDLWNLARSRHRRIMKWVHTWPGPVIMTSRERMAVVYKDDKPTKDRDWTLESRKELPSQVTVWVRLHLDSAPPEILKLRSGRLGIAVADGKAKKMARFNPAELIFDTIGCEVGVSRAPIHRDGNADQVVTGDNPDADHYQAAAMAAAGDVDRLKALYDEVKARGLLQTEVPGQDGDPVKLGALIYALAGSPAGGVTEPPAAVPPATVPPSADPPAANSAAPPDGDLVESDQLRALRASLATLGVREASQHALVAARLLGRPIPGNNLWNLTVVQAETLAVVLAEDGTGAEIAAMLAEQAVA